MLAWLPRSASAQCPVRIDPSFIATLQHPEVKQAAWSMPAITAESIKLRGGLQAVIDAEQRLITTEEGALSAARADEQRDSDRLAMLRDDARLHREYLRMLRCHANGPVPGPSASVDVGAARITVSGGSRRYRNPGSDLVNSLLNRPANSATEDKRRSELAANDAARQEFNNLQLDAPSSSSFKNTELQALRSSLLTIEDPKLADAFALLAGDTPKAAASPEAGSAPPNSTCPKGAAGFNGFCAGPGRYDTSIPRYTIQAAQLWDANDSARAVRTMKARGALPAPLPNAVVEYLELGLEQEGTSGQLFIESTGQAADAATAWRAFLEPGGSVPRRTEYLFDFTKNSPPPPHEDAITVGLRQLDDTMRIVIDARSVIDITSAAGSPSDALASEMCSRCTAANAASASPPTASAYQTLIALLK